MKSVFKYYYVVSKDSWTWGSTKPTSLDNCKKAILLKIPYSLSDSYEIDAVLASLENTLTLEKLAPSIDTYVHSKSCTIQLEHLKIEE